MMLSFFTFVNLYVAISIQIDTSRDFLFIILCFHLLLHTEGVGKFILELLTSIQSLLLYSLFVFRSNKARVLHGVSIFVKGFVMGIELPQWFW